MAETGEGRWEYLMFHDLRRTWAGQLANADINQTVALQWRLKRSRYVPEHYRGEATEIDTGEERGVEWLLIK